MPSYVIPQGVSVRLIWTLAGTDTAVNVLGAKNASSLAITQTLTNTIGAAIKSALGTAGLRTLLSTNVGLRAVGLRDVNVANLPEFLDSGAGTNGLSASDLLPGNVCYCVTIRTSKAGKRYRGRYYQWGITESDNTSLGVPSSTSITACVAFVNAIGAVLSANGLAPAVLSRAANDATVWSFAVNRNTTWSTQRRRLLPGI